MIIRINVEDLDEEIFQVDIDSDEKKTPSSPLQEITNEPFVKQVISDNPEPNTGTESTEGNLLEVNYKDTT
ncbi:MAG: hypothetical protein YK1309IOTA_1470012 [Marine Group I thaumarchaeote]|nr:MAG: hypothetical protein YK1309IOTA_1470012 [Marine Group I thaumarchaeote]